MDVASHFNMTTLPFAAGPRPLIETPGVVAARAELMDLLAHGTTLVFVESAPGAGKSALLRSVAGKLLADGRHVRFCDTPAKLNEAGLAGIDFLVIDEADRLPPERFRQLAENAARRHRVVVAAISPETAEALHLSAPVVTVRGLAVAETEPFLRAHLERAGASDFPFSKAAVAGLAEASGGSVRALKALAGAALVEAMVERDSTVTSAHVEHAVTEFRGSCNHVGNGHAPAETAAVADLEAANKPLAEAPPLDAPAPAPVAPPTPDPEEPTRPLAAPTFSADNPPHSPSSGAAEQGPAAETTNTFPPAPDPAAPPQPAAETPLPIPEPLEARVQSGLPAVVPPAALPVLPASALLTPLPHPLRRAAQILPLAAAAALVAAVTLMWSQGGNHPTSSPATPPAKQSAETTSPSRAAASAAAPSAAAPAAAEAAPGTPHETALAASSPDLAAPAVAGSAPSPDKRVVIRYSEEMENGAEQAYALAGRLERDGWTVGEVAAVSGPIAEASIRHFSRGDAAAAAALDRDLASALPAAPVEFVASGGPRRPGTIEVWIPET